MAREEMNKIVNKDEDFLARVFSPSHALLLCSFVCALALADLGYCGSFVLFASRRAKEEPPAGSSLDFPGPTAGEERLPRLWIPPLPPQVQPPL
ncbi:MAG: hypothetical protein J6V24_09160, partial [Clostridia bacterium]|nr:hypothetical protein [Clostridia bacterium]